jgi:Leucine-rich repeat (LRR) protein
MAAGGPSAASSSRRGCRDIIAHGLEAGILDLSNHKVERADVISLAKALADSSSRLVELNLYNIRISPEDTVVLAKGLEFNSSLRTLNFEHNSIATLGVSALTESFKFSRSLERLSLASTALNATAAAAVAAALSMNLSLKHLSLEGNHLIGAEGARALAEALKVNAVLASLDLRGCSVGDSGAEYIAGALAVNGALEKLNLASNDLTFVGADRVGCALVARNGDLASSLRELVMNREVLLAPFFRGESAGEGTTAVDLSQRALSAELDYPVIMRLLSCRLGPPAHQPLTKLLLSGSGLCGIMADGRGQRTSHGVTSLCTLLRTTESVQESLLEMDLSKNFLQDSVSSASACVRVRPHLTHSALPPPASQSLLLLAGALRSMRGLTRLRLAGNDAGPASFPHVLDALGSSCSALTELDISSNPRVGPRIGASLGSLLGASKLSPTIKVLRASGCGLGPMGVTALSGGVRNALRLESLELHDNGMQDEGALSLGKALMGVAAEGRVRLKSFSGDAWAVVAGQKELDLRPQPLSSSAQAALVAGVVGCNPWMRVLRLDGSRLDRGAVESLLTVLRLSSTLHTLSLRGCQLDSACGRELLSIARAKPGLQIFAQDNPQVGGDHLSLLAAAAEESQRLLDPDPGGIVGGSIHLLGDAGAGKSTLKLALTRGFWASLTRADLERADDRGTDENPETTTRGVTLERVTIKATHFWLYDHGGGASGQLFASQHLLSCPCSIFVIVINLMNSRASQRSQIKHWVRLIQSCAGPVIDKCSVALIGSRADRIGSQVGDDYISKLWSSAWEELTKEELRAGLDPSLAPCISVKALDCRKSQSGAMNDLRDAMCRFSSETGRLEGPRLFLAAQRRVEEWRSGGQFALPWADFWKALQRELFPRLPEKSAEDIARGLQAVAGVHLVWKRGVIVWVVLHAGPVLMLVGDLLEGDSPLFTGAELARLALDRNVALALDRLANLLLDMGVCAQVAGEEPEDLSKRSFRLPQLRSSHRNTPSPGLANAHPAFSAEQGLASLCGRRFVCRSPLMIPGVFLRIQVTLATRYGAGASMQLSFCELWAKLQGMQVVLVMSGSSEAADSSHWIDLVVAAETDVSAVAELNAAAAIAREILCEFSGIGVTECAISRESLRSHKVSDFSVVPLDDLSSGKPTVQLRNGSSARAADFLLLEGGFAVAGHDAATGAVFGGSSPCNPFLKSPGDGGPVPPARKALNPFAVSAAKPPPPVARSANDAGAGNPFAAASIPVAGAHGQEKTGREEKKERERAPATADSATSDAPRAAGTTDDWKLDEDFLSDPSKMFAPCFEEKTFSFPEERFEVTLLGPGAFTLVEFAPTGEAAGDEHHPLYAQVADVRDASVLSSFNFIGSNSLVPLVGSLVAAVAERPWSKEDGDEAWEYSRVMKALSEAKLFPLFVQLIRPASVGLDNLPRSPSRRRSSLKRRLRFSQVRPLFCSCPISSVPPTIRAPPPPHLVPSPAGARVYQQRCSTER